MSMTAIADVERAMCRTQTPVAARLEEGLSESNLEAAASVRTLHAHTL
jgi:hypothetical protein